MENIKKYLEENQPIVYKIINNTFKNKKNTHAYIINGSKGAPLLSVAQFIAQSLICENHHEDNLACLECLNCKRIENETYADCLYYHGEDLKKDQVLFIQREFNKSAIENANVQIYIISEIEKAPVASLNKLLKFIEEPQANIVAIFTTHSLSSILPTIISRCQVITLKQFSFHDLKTQMINSCPNSSIDDINLICKVSNDLERNIKIINDENFPLLKEILIESLKFISNKSDMYIVYMDTQGLSKLQEMNYSDMYLDMLEATFMEALIKKSNDDEETFLEPYISNLAKSRKNLDKKIIDIMIAKQELLSNSNVQLLYDKLFIKLLGDEE